MNINTDAILRLRDYLLDDRPSAPLPDATNSTGSSDSMVRRVEPFAEIMYLVTAADGHLADREFAALTAALRVLTDDRIGAETIGTMLQGFEQTSAAGSSTARLTYLGARLGMEREDREMAFLLAAAIALADDHVAVEESAIMQELRDALGISERRMRALLDDMN